MNKQNKNIKLELMRHSASHLLAAAVKNLWPDTKFAIGPAIDTGFYYDFEFKKPISEKDLPKIEKEMQRLKNKNLSFTKYELPVTNALNKEKGQPYKKELISDLKKAGASRVMFYKMGDFEDLCRGPHLPNTSDIGFFKLLSVAGAYWKGDEKNQMMTRIYGTVWSSKQELEDFLKNQEEAKETDHRKIGQEQELFAFSAEVGPGLALWLPNGTIIKEELEKFAKEQEAKAGYQRISTPHITKESLYYLSGHLPYYANTMFPAMKLEDGNYYLKPMNCPHTHMVYKAKQHSYKDLPIRYAEFGTVYRNEKSGELFGLMRVRGLTQNDGHIYCTEEQAIEELTNVMKLHAFYYQTFGISEYYVELALPDNENKKGKYFDDETGWKQSVRLLQKAARKSKINYIEKVGEAAFYGPKFDFNVKSAIGREFGASTNQLDFGSGKRFGLTYTDRGGSEKIIPYIIHRAPLGSDERFIGFLIEHFKGAFPVWLSPVQVAILPITERNLKYAKNVLQQLTENGIRTELDEKNETVSAKIREAQLKKVPYMFILGDREEENNTVSIRLRTGESQGSLKIKEAIRKIEPIISKRLLSL